MNSETAKRKLLGMFSQEQQTHLKPLIDALTNAAYTEGIVRGRAEAATMVEVLVLGDGDLSHESLRQVMHSLRGDA